MSDISRALRLAILDDYRDDARRFADWSRLPSHVSVTTFTEHLRGHELIRQLRPFDILIIMRERTPFSRDVVEQLPNLKLLVTTGARNLAINTARADLVDEQALLDCVDQRDNRRRRIGCAW